MTLGQSLLGESMHPVARQIFGKANDREVELGPLLDGNRPVLDQLLTRRQLRVLDFPERSVFIDTSEQPGQQLQQPDVQLVRQLWIRTLERVFRQRRGLRIRM